MAKKPIGRPKKSLTAKKPVVRRSASESRSATAKKTGVSGKVDLTEKQLEAKKKKQSKPALKPSEQAELTAFWESGEFTLRELSARYGRTQETLSRYFTSNGILRGCKAEEYSKMIHDRVLEELMGDAGATAKKLRTIKDEFMMRHDYVVKAAHIELVQCKQNNRPFHAALPNLRALKEFQNILENCRREQYVLLNAEEFEARLEQEDIPELIISELTSKDIEDMKKTQEEIYKLDGDDLPDYQSSDELQGQNKVVDES